MPCLCGIKNCKFTERITVSRQKFIVTLECTLKLQDIIHILMCGVKILNLDLTFGTSEEHEKLNNSMNEAIRIYEENSEFNIPIGKICTIRGKSRIAGRMRNDCTWCLEDSDLIILTSDQRYETCSTNQVCYISNFEKAILMLNVCDIIQLGNIELQIVKIVDCYVTCYVLNSGELKSYQKLSCPQLNENEEVRAVEQEIQDCNFAINHNFDYILVPNVKIPEYYHVIEKLIKNAGVKLIARIETNVDFSLIERISNHFDAVYVGIKDLNLDDFSKKVFKPMIFKFSKGNCVSRKTIQTCEMADCFELKIDNIMKLIKASIKLEKINANIDKYAEYNIPHDKLDDEVNNCYYSYSKSATNAAKKLLSKAIIYITKTGDTVRNVIKDFENRYIVALTKDECTAKKLQLWKNVVPMIYVDCEKKMWKEQLAEMTKIGMKFLFVYKIVCDENAVTVQYEE